MSDEGLEGTHEIRMPDTELHPIAVRVVGRRERSGDESPRIQAVGSLEEKLERQLAEARWIAARIKELQPDWDELGFYRAVQAHPPTRRLRKARTGTATD